MSTRAAKHGESGFTMIEVMIVCVILGIVASISLVAFVNALERSRQRATMSDMRTISKAVEAYMIDHNRAPGSTGDLALLAPFLIPYQTSVVPVRDFWRHNYVYSSDSFNDYSIQSFGKDGIDGADITVGTRFDYNLDLVLTNGQFTASPE